MVLMIEHPPQGTVCADCGGDFMHKTDPDGEPGWACAKDSEHIGYKSGADLAMLRDEAMVHSPYPGVQRHMAKRSPIFAGAGDAVIMHRLMTRSKLNPWQAAAFLVHAKTLQLDPFLGQIAPLTFKEGNQGGQHVNPDSRTLEIMITEKGIAALAYRTEPDEFIGNPRLKALTEEEKVEHGWEKDDVAYWARGRKRTWPQDYETEVAARVTKDEIRTWESQGVPAGKDPHHHCRKRVTRRWYEENYPDAAAMAASGEGIEAASIEVQKIIDGTGGIAALTAGPGGTSTEPEGLNEDGTVDKADIANWMNFCPKHNGAEFFQTSKMREPAHKPTTGPWCNRSKVIAEIIWPRIDKMAGAVGQTKAQVDSWVKSTFNGSTRSKLKAEELMEAHELYKGVAVSLSPEIDSELPAADPESEPQEMDEVLEQKSGEEPSTGPTAQATKRSDEDREREEAMSREMDEQLEGGSNDN